MKTIDLPKPPKGALQRARNLRNNMTEAEWKLWGTIRKNQLGIRFRRQHPIGNYIVDFVAIKIGLVIEVDGVQHLDDNTIAYDKERTAYLERLGLKILRFNNYEVLNNIEGVISKLILVIEKMDK